MSIRLVCGERGTSGMAQRETEIMASCGVNVRRDDGPVINRCYHTKRSALPKEYFERVSHCYELEYIPWGEGHVITDGVDLPAVSGTVFFRRPNMKIHGILPYSSYGILLDSIPVDDLPLVSRFSTSHTISYFFQEIYASYLSSGENEEYKMRAAIYSIIYHLKENQNCVSQNRRSTSAQYHTERLNNLTRYINENLDQHLTLEDLARECDISPSFLCRLFKQVHGETVFSYLQSQRIQKAKKLLIETNKPIKEVCLSCGFENESYFYRTFKKCQRVTPTDFRRIHQQPFFDMSE